MKDTGKQQIARGHSESTTGLSDSDLNKKALCDYVANVAKGCPHGCEFCYNKAAPQYTFDPGGEIEAHGRDGSDDWGDYVLYRDRLPEAVAKDLERGLSKWTDRGRGVVGLCFGTDPYFDPTAARITGITLRVLRDHLRPARVLTRNPALAWQKHAPLFVELAQFGLVTIGASIPTLNEDEVSAVEPRAQPVRRRLEYLKRFSAAGVPVYVSMSPTYPTIRAPREMRELLEAIAEVDPAVVFHEPINPRKGNMADTRQAALHAGEYHLADQLAELEGDMDAWYRYACTHLKWAQREAQDLDLPIHLWPDQQLVDNAEFSEEMWLETWKKRQSPEPWPQRDTPDAPLPSPPPEFSWEQQMGLEEFA